MRVLAAMILSIGIAGFSGAGVAAPLSPAPRDAYVPPTQEEMASIGCLVAGTATVIAVGTLGAMTVAASGGAAASYSVEALPVLGAAFAAGCGVGVMAAPGAAWLIDHFDYLVRGRPDETRDVNHGRDGVHDGTVEFAWRK